MSDGHPGMHREARRQHDAVPASPTGTRAEVAAPGPWALGAIVVSATLVAAAVIWPGVAETLLRALLLILALGFVAERALRGTVPSATTQASWSPFHAGALDARQADAPDTVRKWARRLEGYDDEGGPDRPAPWPVLRALLGEATRRLATGHGLDAADPGDVPRIASLLSPPTLVLLGLYTPGSSHPPPHPEERIVRLRDLDTVIDDLERL